MRRWGLQVSANRAQSGNQMRNFLANLMGAMERAPNKRHDHRLLRKSLARCESMFA